MAKATHNGTCQACGNVQANTPNGIAKHGYTVDWGFFNGVCPGSDRPALEISRHYADGTIQRLEDGADQLEALTLADITEVTAKWASRSSFNKNPAESHVITSQFDIDWIIAHGSRAVVNGTRWNNDGYPVGLQQRELAAKHRQASQYRKHVETLRGLIATRHGQDLYPRDTGIERMKDEGPFPKYSDAFERAEALKAEGWKTRINGGRNSPLNITATRGPQ